MKSDIDSYINALPEWQRTICTQLRELIHTTDSSISETIRWNSPAFEKNGLLCWFWAFKKHVSIVFLNGSDIPDTHRLFNAGLQNKHNRAIHFHEGDTVPPQIAEYIRLAIKNNSRS